MTIYALLGIIIAVILIIVLVYFHTVPKLLEHKLTYEGKTLTTSSKPIFVSSDGVDTIVYNTSKGVTLYDTNTNTSKILNPVIATGLAFSDQDNCFLVLEENGNISSLKRTGEKVFINQGGQKLYDVTGGYYMRINNYEFYTSQDKTPVNGSYGLIRLVIT